ncbi:acid phosphatase/vanadium-dependent haloperoxidase related protein [Syntrophobotulus glycolicus DSM 8271]|uniref:Acid phosphatase/vanadium-dependent haloperoxidase related protein n=1 Tax=Syntrophobotulus glycolicus (strain DSM 8271 / FlGlyR) TaxID=645991 RepID=F0T097_SYNGF|nr:divergent PAP2 family protein [Syntrophobotulus glycolicus]ADY56184.1 acid phosphatase/vanadium-dependent haloperoxidase related protein [Syntrophobotulus glycolicus DSM 8271]
MEFFLSFLANKVMLISLLAWFIAQLAKVMMNFLIERKIDFRLIFSSGGFPSSHTAIVCALAISIGKIYGWDTPSFAIAVVLAVIVMYDATGVRRAAGKHAMAINNLVEKLSQNQKFDRFGQNVQQERLKELIGHTPFEVFGGALVGILVSLFC